MRPPIELVTLEERIRSVEKLHEFTVAFDGNWRTRRLWVESRLSHATIEAARGLPGAAVLAGLADGQGVEQYEAAKSDLLATAQQVAAEVDRMGYFQALLSASDLLGAVNLQSMDPYLLQRTFYSSLVRDLGISSPYRKRFWEQVEHRKDTVLGRPFDYSEMLARFDQNRQLLDSGGMEWEYLSPFRWTVFVGTVLCAAGSLAPLFLAPPVGASVAMVFVVAGATFLAAGP
ncbi:MAG: hypothetical protein ABR978_05960 [Dehalococcoidia bacterium]|jgi:hypothetical protein